MLSLHLSFKSVKLLPSGRAAGALEPSLLPPNPHGSGNSQTFKHLGFPPRALPGWRSTFICSMWSRSVMLDSDDSRSTHQPVTAENWLVNKYLHLFALHGIALNWEPTVRLSLGWSPLLGEGQNLILGFYLITWQIWWHSNASVTVT